MQAHDVRAALDAIPAGATGADAFSRVETFGHGGIFVGRFSGQSPWERHRNGDELVHVLEGEVDITVLTDGEPVRATLRAGSIFVVPQGLWHRQLTRGEVEMMTATPQPTDVSWADDPRK